MTSEYYDGYKAGYEAGKGDKVAKLTVPININWNDIKDKLAEGNIVAVVRCKDCKNRSIWKTKSGEYGGLECYRLDMDVDSTFFCAYGERREDAEIH